MTKTVTSDQKVILKHNIARLYENLQNRQLAISSVKLKIIL